jgi:hypothetical protein
LSPAREAAASASATAALAQFLAAKESAQSAGTYAPADLRPTATQTKMLGGLLGRLYSSCSRWASMNGGHDSGDRCSLDEPAFNNAARRPAPDP